MPMTLYVPGLTDAEYEEFCRKYSDFQVEYTGEGEIVVMPPTDLETGNRCAMVVYQLMGWSLARGMGVVTDSSSGYHLKDGARLAPDAAWISDPRPGQNPRCPEFVIEVMSPFDRKAKVEEKVRAWIENGAELAWMIDPKPKRVTVYRAGAGPETLDGVMTIKGEGPVEGFELDLDRIWVRR